MRCPTNDNRRPRLAATLALCAAIVVATACEPPKWRDPPWPDATADGAAIEDDLPAPPWDAGADSSAPVPLCPNHVLECPPGFGCHAGKCGGCASANECRALEGCVAGLCGACKQASDCKEGKSCINGFCLRRPLVVWELTVDPAAWAKIHAAPNKKLYAPCKLQVGETTYEDGCEIRIRGGISKQYAKLSYRIRFPEGAEHPGYSRKINLRSEYNDATYMRNLLANWLFDQLTDVAAPRVRYRRLKVNGADYGVYAEVERIGSSFRRQRGRSDNAPLYEADPPQDLAAKGAGALLPLTPPSLYELAYTKHDGQQESYDDLITLIETYLWSDHIDGGSKRLRKTIDVERYVEYLAMQGALLGMDHVRKNYYLSPQPAADGQSRWEFFPWDLDMTFGCVWSETAELNLCDQLATGTTWDSGVIESGMQTEYPVGPSDFFNVAIDIVLSDPELRARVQARICALTGSEIWKFKLPKLVDALEAQLLDELASDSRDRNASSQDFKTAVASLRTWISKRGELLQFNLDCGW